MATARPASRCAARNARWSRCSRSLGPAAVLASQFVRRGYGAQTRPGHDGRVRLVELTDRGRAARLAAIEIADDIEAELVEKLGRDALDGWHRVTDAVIETHLSEAPRMVRMAAEMSSSPD